MKTLTSFLIGFCILFLIVDFDARNKPPLEKEETVYMFSPDQMVNSPIGQVKILARHDVNGISYQCLSSEDTTITFYESELEFVE